MIQTYEIVANKLKLDNKQIKAVLKLISEGATVPFIARYRKHLTGGLDENVVNEVYKTFNYNKELIERKEVIIKILKEHKLLSNTLLNSINKVNKKSDLESLYEPFKKGKITKASNAIKLGLESLAISIMSSTDKNFNPYIEANKYITKNVENVEFAIEECKYIIAQFIATNLKVLKYIENQIINYGLIKTKTKRNYLEKDPNQKMQNYYAINQRVNKISNHRIIAISRAEKRKIVNISFEYNTEKIEYDLNNMFFKIPSTSKIIRSALHDSLKRLIYKNVETKVFNWLFEKAEKSALELFSKNLEALLLLPSTKNKRPLVIDPAFQSGCKIACLDEDGTLLDTSIIYPNIGKNKIFESENILLNLIKVHKMNIILIGNGTASRETYSFITNLFKKESIDIEILIVSEIGASVYSASKVAAEEFPDLTLEKRSAIHIGRKYQDPLNELVKIDPKSIGVGQYQHDMNQKYLSKQLKFSVDKIVNKVGVDLNTATKSILIHISGITPTLANNILEYKKKNGLFKNRNELKKVKGIGLKSFQQCIGFLRIYNSNNWFDKTNIHPESYILAKKLYNWFREDIDSGNLEVDKLNLIELSNKFNIDSYSIELILRSLKEPGKDIRVKKGGLEFMENINSFEELSLEQEIQGTVQNITDFGVFVSIGIKESVLIHISKMSNEYVSHPSDIVKVGDSVQLRVIGIDNEKRQIKGELIR